MRKPTPPELYSPNSKPNSTWPDKTKPKPATSPQSITPPPKPTTSSKKSENKHKKKHNTKPITQTLGPESKPGSPAIRNWASLKVSSSATAVWLKFAIEVIHWLASGVWLR